MIIHSHQMQMNEGIMHQ